MSSLLTPITLLLIFKLRWATDHHNHQKSHFDVISYIQASLAEQGKLKCSNRAWKNIKLSAGVHPTSFGNSLILISGQFQ